MAQRVPPMHRPISLLGMNVTFTSRGVGHGLHMSELSANTSTSTSRQRLRRTPQKSYTSRHPAIDSMHWLFRTNIPRRRSSYYQPDIRKRNFFGMGEIIGVLTNPAETVRSLTESKRLLEEARREINETRERAQIRPKHTFSRLPGFYARTAELKAIERALEGDPAFTVLFGASSVGKTALLREVLCNEKYHVLHFDLRIAGFADLASLYMSLSEQMEQYFEEISKQMDGYKEFEKEAWSFKHDRLNVERRLQDSPPESGIHRVKTSDIARLMELFQSSLLKYWKFEPFTDEDSSKKLESETGSTSDQTHVNSHSQGHSKRKWKLRNLLSDRNKKDRTDNRGTANQGQGSSRTEKPKPVKKMPVIFFDEAHKLPALIQSTEAMNCLLSTFLVLTKQDRLCHVIHATSDPFYHTWLRRLNVMQHCKIITIGDCSKSDTRKFFHEKLLPEVPQRLRPGLDFEKLYETFGGKLVHWQDYILDFVNSNGNQEINQSSHFLQAHALLNLHIIHSSQSPNGTSNSQPDNSASQPSGNPEAPPPLASAPSNASGFRIYSAISHPHGPDDETGPPSEGYDSFTAMQLLKVMARITQPGVEYLPYFMLCREFGVRAVDGMVKGRVLDLRWTEIVSGENGETDEGDHMTGHDGASRPPNGTGTGTGPRAPVYNGFDSRPGSVPGYMVDPGSSLTAVNNEEMFGMRPPPPPPMPHNESDEEMVPVSEREAMLASDHGYRQRQQYQFPAPPPISPMSPPPPNYPQAQGRPSYRARRSTRYRSYQIQSRYDDPYAAVMEVVGPKLVPITPVMRYAMKEVIAEYQEEEPEEEEEDLEGEGIEAISIGRGSRRTRRGTGTGTGTDGASEYASLSDVDEY